MTIHSPARHTPFTPRTVAALTGILLVGAFLRLHALDSESAWLDEAFAIRIARGGLDEIFLETRLDVHPPLYYIVLSGWLALTGGSVWSARLLSVVFSLMTLVATHVVGTRLAGRTAGLAAASLLAVSVFQIEFAQEARMYAQLTLLATLSMYGFIRLFDRPHPGWFITYTVATLLMTWTHVYAAFIIAAQALVVGIDLLWRRRGALETTGCWIAAQSLVFAAFLWWLPVFTWQVSLVQTRFWIAEPPPFGFLTAFRTYAGSPALLRILLGLAALGLWRVSRPRAEASSPRPAWLFLLPWLAAPIAIPFALSFVGSPIFLPKYTIAASVPFALLAAAGIAALPGAWLRLAVLTVTVIVSTTSLPRLYDVQTKDGWRQAVPIVERLAGPDDAVVVYPYFNTLAYDLYRQRTDLQVRAFPLFTAPPPADGWSVTYSRATANRDRIWFVALRADPTVEVAIEPLREHFDLVDEYLEQQIVIYHFVRRR